MGAKTVFLNTKNQQVQKGLAGGMAGKRARTVIHDTKVAANDADSIKAALNFKAPDLKSFIKEMKLLEQQALFNFIMKQKNMDRIKDYVVLQLEQFNAIEAG